jgi:uncharacterized membrane protein
MKQDFIPKLLKFFERDGKIVASRNGSNLDLTFDMKEFIMFMDARNKIQEESYRLVDQKILSLKEENEKLKNKIKELEKYKQIIDEIKLRRAVLNLDEDHRIARKLKKSTYIFDELREKEDDEAIEVLKDFSELKPPKF